MTPPCLLHNISMSAEKQSQHLVSDDEKRQALKAATTRIAKRLGVRPEIFEAKITWGLNSESSAEHQHELAKAMGLQMAFQSLDDLLLSIRTKEDLDRTVERFIALEEQAPTIARNTMDKIRSKLVRRGGPGREPKLNPRESTIVCEEILKLVGKKKYKHKDALIEVSRMCPDLLQKTISPRTIQKAWDKRDEFLRD